MFRQQQEQQGQGGYFPPPPERGGHIYQQPFPPGSYHPSTVAVQHQQQHPQQQYQQAYQQQHQQQYAPPPQQTPGSVSSQQPGPAAGHPPAPPPQHAVTDRFAHVRHLAIFPILGAEESDALATVAGFSRQAASLVNPTATRQAANVMWNTTSQTAALASTTFSTAVVTRWAAIDPATRSTVIADVWEGRGSKSWMANTIWLVCNADAKLRVRDKWDVKVKAGKMWSKNLNTKPLESMVLLTEDGATTNIPFEIINRQERALSQVEIPHIKDRFKSWRVPG